MEGINDLLRAADGEGGDDDLAFALEGLEHELADLGIGVGFGGMFARAVSALDLEIIHVFHGLRVAQNVVVAATDVAAEQVPEPAPVLADVQHHLRGAEDVAGVAEGDGHAIGDREGAVVVDADELADGFVGIAGGVKRLDGREAPFGALLGDEGGVVALNFSRVLEHDAGEVARGEGAEDVALETLTAEVRQVPAVVNVRVTEHDGVNSLRVKGEVAVALDGFAAVALKQAAFEQEPLSVELKQIERARGGAGRAEEVNAHPAQVWRKVIRALPRS